MNPEPAQFDLLPAERLIADRRNDVSATEVDAAPSLRVAAAEVVREGYLLHYGEPRWYDVADGDLALLAGDRMYAAGLAALAEEGDTEAVSALADAAGGWDPSGQEAVELLGLLADLEATPDHHAEQGDQAQHAKQTKLLGEDREDEVGVHFRQVHELLYAVAQADAEPLAPADGDQRLGELKARAQRVFPGIGE